MSKSLFVRVSFSLNLLYDKLTMLYSIFLLIRSKIAMRITVNGEKKECPTGTSLSELLNNLDIDERHVAVELNLKIVPRSQFSEKLLTENDTLEIVTFVGGG